MQSDLAIMLLRTLFLYFFIMIMFRVMGKREIGKLSIFDLVVSIMIAEIAVFSIEDPDMPLIRGIGPMVFLVIIQIALSHISLKNRTIREFIDGKPSVIIDKGQLNAKEMRRLRYNFDDLMTQLREKSVTNITDVEFAILETTGKLSVILKEEKDNLSIALPVIIDGEVLDENLDKLGKTRLWLKQQLKDYGTTDFQRVFFASVDANGLLFVDLRRP